MNTQESRIEALERANRPWRWMGVGAAIVVAVIMCTGAGMVLAHAAGGPEKQQADAAWMNAQAQITNRDWVVDCCDRTFDAYRVQYPDVLVSFDYSGPMQLWINIRWVGDNQLRGAVCELLAVRTVQAVAEKMGVEMPRGSVYVEFKPWPAKDFPMGLIGANAAKGEWEHAVRQRTEGMGVTVSEILGELPAPTSKGETWRTY